MSGELASSNHAGLKIPRLADVVIQVNSKLDYSDQDKKSNSYKILDDIDELYCGANGLKDVDSWGGDSLITNIVYAHRDIRQRFGNFADGNNVPYNSAYDPINWDTGTDISTVKDWGLRYWITEPKQSVLAQDIRSGGRVLLDLRCLPHKHDHVIEILALEIGQVRNRQSHILGTPERAALHLRLQLKLPRQVAHVIPFFKGGQPVNALEILFLLVRNHTGLAVLVRPILEDRPLLDKFIAGHTESTGVTHAGDLRADDAALSWRIGKLRPKRRPVF